MKMRSYRAPLTRTALLLAGAAAVLVGGQGGAEAAFPGGNGKIAYEAFVGGTREIIVVNADGSGRTQLTANSVTDSGPSWSADGTRIAFFRDVPTGDGILNREIFVMNADGSGQTRLTTNDARDEDPTWSPDGSRIVFWSNRDGNEEIYVMDPDGSNLTRLTTDGAADAYPAWSPDGTKIAFASARDGNFEIWVMNADGSSAAQLTHTDLLGNLYPDWSPDGTKVVFRRTHAGLGVNQIVVANADGSGETVVSANFTEGGIGRPTWSPDGTKITLGASGIVVMNADGSSRVQLTTDGGFSPSWQPAGGQTVFADLSLTLEASGKKANTGKPLTYTISIENRGPAPAAGVVVSDLLDPNERFSSVTSTSGTCTPPAVGSSGTVVCELGQLAVSDTVEIEVVVELPPKKTFGSAKPEVSHTAAVGGSTVDAVVGNDAATVVTDVVGP